MAVLLFSGSRWLLLGHGRHEAFAQGTTQGAPAFQDSDLNKNGLIDHDDFRMLITVWHGLATPVPSPTPTPTETPTGTETPTWTATPTIGYTIDGFWVGDYKEYYSIDRSVHRTGQFLWYLKLNGTQVTGRGDDFQYPISINGTFKDGVLRGTLSSFTNFTLFAFQDIPQSATAGYTPKFEGLMFGSKNNLD